MLVFSVWLVGWGWRLFSHRHRTRAFHVLQKKKNEKNNTLRRTTRAKTGDDKTRRVGEGGEKSTGIVSGIYIDSSFSSAARESWKIKQKNRRIKTQRNRDSIVYIQHLSSKSSSMSSKTRAHDVIKVMWRCRCVCWQWRHSSRVVVVGNFFFTTTTTGITMM